MSIVSTVILSDRGNPRLVLYACTDSIGQVTKYGPVIASASFDAEAHKTVVAGKVAVSLAEQEALNLLGNP